MKFENLKKPEPCWPQTPKIEGEFWTTSKCKLLAQNYYMLESESLRKLFGGYSWAHLYRKMKELEKNGWNFRRPDVGEDHRVHYLYQITNKNNGKVYVGVSVHPSKRVSDHLNRRGSSEIAKDYRDEFEWEILDEGPHDSIYALEALMIENLDCLRPKGYNIVSGHHKL